MEHYKNPVPQGQYVPATRGGQLIYTAGVTPRRDGVLIMAQQIKKDEPLELYREAVCLAAENALNAARNQLAEGESLRLLALTVYVNADVFYTAHSRLADFASAFFCQELGDAGLCARTCVGVASLPGEAPVELQLVAMAV